MKTKSDLIKDIVKATRSQGDKVFDTLNDHSEQYLTKLLKVIKGL